MTTRAGSPKSSETGEARPQGAAQTLRAADLNVVTSDGGLSLRERNKADKLQRIKDAALAMFLSKGFDEATTRDIARIARVALGTLFVYAENKRDLLFLIYNDELAAAIDEARALTGPDRSLLDNLLTIAQVHFQTFVQRPELARAALREMYFYMSGKQAARHTRNRENLAAQFLSVVRDAMTSGEIKSTEDPEMIANIAFILYQGEARTMLMAEKPDMTAALNSFARQMVVMITGLQAEPGAVALDRTRWRAVRGR